MWTRLACFIALSYPIPTPASDDFFPNVQHYVKGPADIRFVIGWAIIFALLREVLMRAVFAPFIRYWIGSGTRRKPSPEPASPSGFVSHNSGVSRSNGEYALSEVKQRGKQGANGNGIVSNGKPTAETMASAKLTNVEIRARRERNKEAKATRFAEQGWNVAYYSIYWAFGLVSLHYNNAANRVPKTDVVCSTYTTTLQFIHSTSIIYGLVFPRSIYHSRGRSNCTTSLNWRSGSTSYS